jgi:hypothetical protein
VSTYRIDVLNRAPAATLGSHFGLKKVQTLTATNAVGTFTLAYGALPAAPYALPGNVSLTHLQVFSTSGTPTGYFTLSYSTVSVLLHFWRTETKCLGDCSSMRGGGG